jgi:glyoxylase-like metal-dependent hydrolase (beta-lactamase superfamily II)
MKYLIISHGHADHHGGTKFLQDEFGPRVVMGRQDWDLVEQNKTLAGGRAIRGKIVPDLVDDRTSGRERIGSFRLRL